MLKSHNHSAHEPKNNPAHQPHCNTAHKPDRNQSVHLATTPGPHDPPIISHPPSHNSQTTAHPPSIDSSGTSSPHSDSNQHKCSPPSQDPSNTTLPRPLTTSRSSTVFKHHETPISATSDASKSIHHDTVTHLPSNPSAPQQSNQITMPQNQDLLSNLSDRVDTLEELISHFLSKIEEIDNASFIPPCQRLQQLEYRLCTVEEKISTIMDHYHNPTSPNVPTPIPQTGAIPRRQSQVPKPSPQTRPNPQSHSTYLNQKLDNPNQHTNVSTRTPNSTMRIPPSSVTPQPNEKCTLLLGDESFTVIQTSELKPTCKVRTLKGAEIEHIKSWVQNKLQFTPSNCIIYAGTLDICNSTPEVVIDKFGTLVSELKNINENMKICVCPLANTYVDHKKRDKIASFNAYIAQWSRDNGLFSIKLPTNLTGKEINGLTYQDRSGYLNKNGVVQLLTALAKQLDSFNEEIKWNELNQMSLPYNPQSRGEPHLTSQSTRHLNNSEHRGNNRSFGPQISPQSYVPPVNPEPPRINNTKHHDPQANVQHQNEPRGYEHQRSFHQTYTNKEYNPPGGRPSPRSQPHFPPPLMDLNIGVQKDRSSNRNTHLSQPSHQNSQRSAQSTKVCYTNSHASIKSSKNNHYPPYSINRNVPLEQSPPYTNRSRHTSSNPPVEGRPSVYCNQSPRAGPYLPHQSHNHENSHHYIDTPASTQRLFRPLNAISGACWNCGEYNHVHKYCRYDHRIKCFTCQAFGHKSKMCKYRYD